MSNVMSAFSWSCVYIDIYFFYPTLIQIFQPVILNYADPVYPLELLDHFCLECLAGWSDTHGQSFVSITALSHSKGAQFSCLVIQLAMPESIPYIQFAKFYYFLICKPVYDGFQAGYLAVEVVNQCLIKWFGV